MTARFHEPKEQQLLIRALATFHPGEMLCLRLSAGGDIWGGVQSAHETTACASGFWRSFDVAGFVCAIPGLPFHGMRVSCLSILVLRAGLPVVALMSAVSGRQRGGHRLPHAGRLMSAGSTRITNSDRSKRAAAPNAG